MPTDDQIIAFGNKFINELNSNNIFSTTTLDAIKNDATLFDFIVTRTLEINPSHHFEKESFITLVIRAIIQNKKYNFVKNYKRWLKKFFPSHVYSQEDIKSLEIFRKIKHFYGYGRGRHATDKFICTLHIARLYSGKKIRSIWNFLPNFQWEQPNSFIKLCIAVYFQEIFDFRWQHAEKIILAMHAYFQSTTFTLHGAKNDLMCIYYDLEYLFDRSDVVCEKHAEWLRHESYLYEYIMPRFPQFIEEDPSQLCSTNNTIFDPYVKSNAMKTALYLFTIGNKYVCEIYNRFEVYANHQFTQQEIDEILEKQEEGYEDYEEYHHILECDIGAFIDSDNDASPYFFLDKFLSFNKLKFAESDAVEQHVDWNEVFFPSFSDKNYPRVMRALNGDDDDNEEYD